MAELINEIISPEAFKQVADMKAELASLTKQMEDMLKAMGKASTATGNKPLGGMPDEIKRTAEEMRQLQIVKNKIITTEAKLNETYIEQAAKLRELNTSLKSSVKEHSLAEGSLDQMRANLNRLEKAYSGLSAVARQGEIGKAMFAEFTKAKEGVTLLEQSMGNYKRNVGNYTNATFPLTQVLREIPAFAYSAQTGILGLSNNLPILADNFKSVAAATNEVTGKVNGTVGAMKIFASSIFSFGNIFAIAIGLFTIFSKEIFAFFQNTEKAKNMVDQLTESFARLDKEIAFNNQHLDMIGRAHV